jgi:hypothetical protein
MEGNVVELIECLLSESAFCETFVFTFLKVILAFYNIS